MATSLKQVKQENEQLKGQIVHNEQCIRELTLSIEQLEARLRQLRDHNVKLETEIRSACDAEVAAAQQETRQWRAGYMRLENACSRSSKVSVDLRSHDQEQNSSAAVKLQDRSIELGEGIKLSAEAGVIQITLGEALLTRLVSCLADDARFNRRNVCINRMNQLGLHLCCAGPTENGPLGAQR